MRFLSLNWVYCKSHKKYVYMYHVYNEKERETLRYSLSSIIFLMMFMFVLCVCVRTDTVGWSLLLCVGGASELLFHKTWSCSLTIDIKKPFVWCWLTWALLLTVSKDKSSDLRSVTERANKAPLDLRSVQSANKEIKKHQWCQWNITIILK